MDRDKLDALTTAVDRYRVGTLQPAWSAVANTQRTAVGFQKGTSARTKLDDVADELADEHGAMYREYLLMVQALRELNAPDANGEYLMGGVEPTPAPEQDS